MTQLIKVLKEEVPTNIGGMEKEQLTHLATIFHSVLKKRTKIDAEKQSITSSQYSVQPSLDETPKDLAIKSTFTLEIYLWLMQMNKEKKHKNTTTVQLTTRLPDKPENLVASTKAAPQQSNIISQEDEI